MQPVRGRVRLAGEGEPGAVDATEWRLLPCRAGRSQALRATTLPAPLRCGRYGTAASTGQAHEQLSGPVKRHILKREFERLGGLYNGQFYNLRCGPRYSLLAEEKTRSAAAQASAHKKPAPKRGHRLLRIDTMREGDGPGNKGSATSTPSATVTQWKESSALPASNSTFQAYPTIGKDWNLIYFMSLQ
ncbi:MAG: hypothetical protein ACP5E5_10400 [Acidobacteriaceae bacterium]